MIREDHITVEIAGPGAKPGTIGVRSLARILSALESGISTVSIEGASDEIAERLAESSLAISLVDVEEGNSGDYWTRMHHPDAQLPAFVLFSDLIENGPTVEHPPAAVKQAEEIAIVCRSEGYTVSVSARTGDFITEAKVTPESKFEVPEPAIVRGQTVIFGQIERVGGKKPKVVIRTRDGNKLTAGLEKRELANTLGERLYQTCGIEGVAEWNSRTEKMVGFTVTGLNAYAGGSVMAGMERMREIAGDAYDEIDDVQEYLREQRGD